MWSRQDSWIVLLMDLIDLSVRFYSPINPQIILTIINIEIMYMLHVGSGTHGQYEKILEIQADNI